MIESYRFCSNFIMLFLLILLAFYENISFCYSNKILKLVSSGCIHIGIVVYCVLQKWDFFNNLTTNLSIEFI